MRRIIESGHASWLNTVIPSWPPCACILNSVVMACCIRANCLGEKEDLLQLQQVGLGVAGRKSIGVISTVTVCEAERQIPRDCHSAATDLAWRARALHEATRRGRPPRLVRLVFGGPCRLRGGVLGRLSRRCRCGLCPCGRCLLVVLLETAMFVFAPRAATTGLVASGLRAGVSSH